MLLLNYFISDYFFNNRCNSRFVNIKQTIWNNYEWNWVIALAGIVVNNNIVLLFDTYKNLRMKGEKIKEALEPEAQRLRPVMLTTLTTFFGLVSMAIGLYIFLDFEINFGSPSSQWWLQLSNAIVFR